MRKFKAEKLIRDKLQEILAQKDIETTCTKIEGKQLLKALQEKLVEETKECMVDDKNEILAELADVIEVIHAIAKACDFSLDQIEQARVKKHADRGGFDEGIYCKDISMQEDNPALTYYLAKPNEYPEITD